MIPSIKINPHISLKPLEPKEAKDMFNLVIKNKARLKPWMIWLSSVKTVKDSRENIKQRSEKIKNGTGFDVGIYYDSVLIGSAGYIEISKGNRKGEIGYWIDGDYEGKGIMSKVVAKFIDLGHKKYKLNRIQIKMDVRNKRSSALPKKFGFKKEGVLKSYYYFDGLYRDIEMWALVSK